MANLYLCVCVCLYVACCGCKGAMCICSVYVMKKNNWCIHKCESQLMLPFLQELIKRCKVLFLELWIKSFYNHMLWSDSFFGYNWETLLLDSTFQFHKHGMMTTIIFDQNNSGKNQKGNVPTDCCCWYKINVILCSLKWQKAFLQYKHSFDRRHSFL